MRLRDKKTQYIVVVQEEEERQAATASNRAFTDTQEREGEREALPYISACNSIVGCGLGCCAEARV